MPGAIIFRADLYWLVMWVKLMVSMLWH